MHFRRLGSKNKSRPEARIPLESWDCFLVRTEEEEEEEEAAKWIWPLKQDKMVCIFGSRAEGAI